MDINSNTVAFITGASRGLGRALVEALADKSPRRIYATARDTSSLSPLVSQYGDLIVAIELDIANPLSVSSAIALAPDVNLLINNAGVFSEGELLNAPIDAIRHDMEVNYFGTLNVIRSFIPMLESNLQRAIVNILSISSLANVPSIGSYSASKAAGHSLTQSIRTLLKNKSIDVHGVFPGPIDTDMTKHMSIPKAQPSEVAHAILRGIEAGEEDIFPDNMSRQGGGTWRNDPKLLEQLLANT